MKPRTVVPSIALIAALAFAGARAVSYQPEGEGGGLKPPSQEEMMAGMKAWMESIKPGEGHERLKRFVGSWDVVTKFTVAPGAPPMTTKGTSEIKWVLGNRFLMEEHKGEMILPDMSSPSGMKTGPYEGIGLTGYDNYRKMYVGTWTSSAQTCLLNFSGNVDRSGKVFTYYGEMDEPILSVIGRHVRYVTKVIDNDKHVLEIYDLHAGEDFKVLEMEYTRRK